MIDQMIDELESVGTIESEGEFTMDRQKARDKMRRFQLADPRAYVLELVQAAALKGATRVRFDIDSRDMQMQFDGRPFTTEDFDDIYGAAFTRRTDHDVLARRQLALGVNSVMALTPTRVTVESGDGRSGARLVLMPEREDSYETIQTDRAGTLVHVRERFSLGTFVDFIKNLRGTLAEEQLLRERCTYASFELDLEGQRLDQGLELHKAEVLETVRFEHGSAAVVCGLSKNHEPVASVDLIKDGVWITTHRLPMERYPRGFMAVVQDHALRKDVSQSDVVRDDAYAHMLDLLDQGAHLALRQLARDFDNDRAPPWAETVLIQQMLQLARDDRLLDEDTTGLRAMLRRLPLWETTAENWVSLDEIHQQTDRHGSALYVEGKRFGGILPPEYSFVLFMRLGSQHRTELLAILEHFFDDRLRDGSRLLQQIVDNDKARRAWRSRPTPPRLPQGTALARHRIDQPDLQGELGLLREQTSARISFVVDGCLLSELDLDLPLPGLRMVLESTHFEPTPTYDGIAATPAACRALLGVIEHLGSLYGELAQGDARSRWLQSLALGFIQVALRNDDLAAELASELGFPPAVRREALAEMEPAARTLSLGLEAEVPHPVTTIPLVRTLGSKTYSLAQLFERARKGETMSVVHKPVRGVEADILVLSTDVRDSIEHLFPDGFDNGWPQVQRIQQRNAFLARAVHKTPIQPRPGQVVVPIEGRDIEGQLGVVPRAGFPARRRTVKVLHQHRPIDSIEVLMVGDCEGWVESTQVRPHADFGGAKESGDLDAVRAAVLQAFARAAVMIAEQAHEQMTDDRRAFLREVVTLVFPHRAFRAAFDRIDNAKGVNAAAKAKAHRQIYAALQTADDPDDFTRQLWRLSHSKNAIADAMALDVTKRATRWALTAVDELVPAAEEPHALAERSLHPIEPLGSLPLFVRHDSETMSLNELADVLSRWKTLLYIDAPQSIDLGKRVMLIADNVHRDQLRRIKGNSGLINGQGLIERERKRSALKAREPAKTIALAAGQALVSTRLLPRVRRSPEGEVGLALEHPAVPQQKPHVSLTLYRERRFIQSTELTDRAFELVVAINSDRFALTLDHDKIHQDRTFREAMEHCESLVPQLISTLLGSWKDRSASERRSGWIHVLDYLVARRPSSPSGWLDAPDLDPVAAKAARFPGFTAAGGGTVSLVDVATVYKRRGHIEVLPPPASSWDSSPFGAERPILVVVDYEREALENLGLEVRPVRKQWPTWKDAQRRRAKAQPQRLPDPSAVLLYIDLPGPVVTGRLALPFRQEPLTVDLCAEQRLVVTRALEGVLPCRGSIGGDGVVPNEGWSDVAIREDAQAVLRSTIVQLYIRLAHWFRQNTDSPRHNWVSSVLRRLVVTLREQERAGELAPEHRPLLDELRSLAVLPVGGGRRISLETALKDKPSALFHLDLWDPTAEETQHIFDEPGDEPEPPPPPRREARSTPSTPPPAAPPATPAEQLVDAIRAELNLVRDRNRSLLAPVNLDRLRVEPLPRRQRALIAWADDAGVLVNQDHPVVQRALDEPADPVWRSFVSLSVYTALNVWLEEVTDNDEMHFLGLMGQLVASG